MFFITGFAEKKTHMPSITIDTVMAQCSVMSRACSYSRKTIWTQMRNLELFREREHLVVVIIEAQSIGGM